MTISDWIITEFSAALAIKLRTNQMSVAHRAEALALFARLRVDSLMVLPVTRQQFHAAARLADQQDLGRRAGDALHLAVCADHGATLCTLDRRLGEAARLVGVHAILV